MAMTTEGFAERVAQALNLLGALASDEAYAQLRAVHDQPALEAQTADAVDVCAEWCDRLQESSENAQWWDRCRQVRPHLERMRKEVAERDIEGLRDSARRVLEVLALSAPSSPA